MFPDRRDGTPQLGLGCARLGSVNGGLGHRASIALVHAGLEHGFTYFDTADAYGNGASETILGTALRGRDDVTVATKGGYTFTERGRLERRARAAAAPLVRRVRSARPAASPSTGSGSYGAHDFAPAALTAALEASLRRLGRERVDVYQLHGPPPNVANSAGDDIAAWGEQMLTTGKIGRLGVGAETLDQATPWIGRTPMSVFQIPFGLLDPEAASTVLGAIAGAGAITVARGVFGAGLLGDHTPATGDNAAKTEQIAALRSLAASRSRSMADVALMYVRAHPEIDVIVTGARTADHVAALQQALRLPLDETLTAELRSLAERATP